MTRYLTENDFPICNLADNNRNDTNKLSGINWLTNDPFYFAQTLFNEISRREKTSPLWFRHVAPDRSYTRVHLRDLAQTSTGLVLRN